MNTLVDCIIDTGWMGFNQLLPPTPLTSDIHCTLIAQLYTPPLPASPFLSFPKNIAPPL